MVNEDASEFPLPLLPKQPIETTIPKGAGLVPEVRELLEKENRLPFVQLKSRHAAEEGLGPRISKKQKVDTNAGRHDQGKKKTSHSRRRHSDVTVQKTIVVLVHDGSKKHIWFKIWMDMFNCFGFPWKSMENMRLEYSD
ncbi:hypothetical protein DPMN_151751 [Dreissena polymorpha]|uniref:Uncharacterized protein n=1 Tax=Dreissena polymorpha TaxID=45954 RepID=A0A9D4FK47_DREPO|nr:hypothetical protein DPMN_151751 [Dreissena polymorpha]